MAHLLAELAPWLGATVTIGASLVTIGGGVLAQVIATSTATTITATSSTTASSLTPTASVCHVDRVPEVVLQELHALLKAEQLGEDFADGDRVGP